MILFLLLGYPLTKSLLFFPTFKHHREVLIFYSSLNILFLHLTRSSKLGSNTSTLVSLVNLGVLITVLDKERKLQLAIRLATSPHVQLLDASLTCIFAPNLTFG